MKIVTWNIRCVWNDGDGINNFIHRAGFVYEKIMNERPEVIAFQEVTEPILACLKRLLCEYDFFGSFRSENYSGEGLFIAVRKDACALLSSDVFWLSPAPFSAGSRFENQSPCPRVCVSTKLRDKKTNEVFRVIDVHLDHVSDEARKEGLKCLFAFADDYTKKDGAPLVVLGDFNATPDSEAIRLCEKKSEWTDVTKKISGTFHDFGRRKDPVKIDYIYVTEELAARTENVSAWTDCVHGVYLSDHYPVCLTLK